jgi:hypothetical protein
MTEKVDDESLAEISHELETFAYLLDPHLAESKKAREPAGAQRWPILKVLAFIFGTSLILWALIIALIYYLL